MIMKKQNKTNKIWWTLFIAGVLSANVGRKVIYNTAYNRAYTKAYDTAYDDAYDDAYHEAYERGFKKRGYKHEIWNIYGGSCADFGLLDESEKAASQIAPQIASQTASQRFVLPSVRH